jgi:hypothetical protein
VASALRSPKTRAVIPTLVAVSAAPTNSDPDHRDGHRGAADPAELGEVHLHADLNEQEEHPQLGELGHRFVVPVDEPE